jgi:hypothetical protein
MTISVVTQNPSVICILTAINRPNEVAITTTVQQAAELSSATLPRNPLSQLFFLLHLSQSSTLAFSRPFQPQILSSTRLLILSIKGPLRARKASPTLFPLNVAEEGPNKFPFH